MKCTSKERETCNVEKMGCEGCYYNDEIKVGEYVRTKDGIISKIIEFDDNYVYTDDEISYCYENGVAIPNCYVEKNEIVKHSKNIINLIEVGDHVNDHKVLDISDSIYNNSKRILIYRNEKEKYERWIYIQEYDGRIHTQDDIESIVTKEQFELGKYKIPGETKC